jgi:hypothetical protein
MIDSKRISVAFSLATYLLATTVVHALHDHSATGNCRSESQACLGPGSTCPGCDPAEFDACHGQQCDAANAGHRSAHHDSPSHSDNCEDSCFACRFLAAKSIAADDVEVVQRTEVLRQVVPRPCISAPVVRPDLPFSRGPPCA